MNLYCINYQNEERKARMTDRYQKLQLSGLFRKLIFTPEVHTSDSRLQVKDLEKTSLKDLRIYSIMLQHLDSVRHFIEETSDEYCIICEDDIHISKELKMKIPGILKVFSSLNLKVLMIGYLFPHKITPNNYFPLIAEYEDLKYTGYEDDIWGCQMYLISRKYAEELLSTYTIDYAIHGKKPFNPDWTITKCEKERRALIVEMLAVEEGNNHSDDEAQKNFHLRCHQVHFNDSFY